jgi:transcriptional regulator with XRE-family HTH domain
VDRLGDAIDQLLHERGLSQSELGRRLDVTGSAVNLWARGKAKPSREHLERIEDELAVEPRGSLLELAGYSTADPAGPTLESLIRADPGLYPEDKRIFLRLIRMARERFAAEAGQRLVEELDRQQ